MRAIGVGIPGTGVGGSLRRRVRRSARDRRGGVARGGWRAGEGDMIREVEGGIRQEWGAGSTTVMAAPA